MKDDLAFKQSKRLGHTRQHAWDPFAALAQAGVKAGGGADAIFGTKPKVAEYKATDLGEEAKGAVRSNIRNYPEISKLLDSIVPGFSGMLKSGAKSAGELIRGEIPKDVQNFLRRSTAFQSLMGGFAGSAMGKALGARDFGKTSLQLQEAGQNSAQRWAALASGLGSPYMVSAAGAGEASFRNKILQQQNQQDIYNVAAAPDPGKKGTFDLQFALGMTAASIGAGMLGGSGYKGGTPGSNTRSAGELTNSDIRNNAMSNPSVVEPYSVGDSNAYFNNTAPLPQAAPASSGGGGSGGPWGMGWRGW